MSQKTKVVLAYSGGLDTSVMLHWLKHKQNMDVICYCADLGQGKELDGLREKALQSGASDLHVLDLREEFVKDYVWMALKANAVYEGIYLMGTSLARPVIAKHQIEIARKTGATAVAHGATGKGNDQVRFELTYYALNPSIQVVAPWREWEFKGRSDLIAYAREHNIPIEVSAEKPYSTDRNLMHISFEGGILEDPWSAPPEDMFLLSNSPEKAPNTPVTMTIEFKKGEPVAVNGEGGSPAQILERLNSIAGEHGVGRIDVVENRYVGIKSRGVYETPGMTVLMSAHRAIESITLDREVLHWRDQWIPKIADCIYNGFWFSPEFQLIQSMLNESQQPVNGEVKLKLYKGNVTILGRKSPNSLYNPHLATFEADSIYNQADATGFIRLNALRLRNWSYQQK